MLHKTYVPTVPSLGQGKALIPSSAREGVVVLVPVSIPLSSHAGVSHDVTYLARDAVLHPMGWLGSFLDTQLVPLEERDPRGIRSPDLGGVPQLLDYAEPLGRCQLTFVVQH